MFCLNLNAGGAHVSIDYKQLHTLFNCSFRFEPPTEEEVSPPPDCHILTFGIDMDPNSKTYKQTKLPLMPQFLVNNPNITVYPASSSQSPNTPTSKPISKQLPYTVNRISRVPLPVSTISSENANNQEKSTSKTVINAKETKNSKRFAASPISTRPQKFPKLSVTEMSSKPKEKIVPKSFDKVSEFNLAKNNQVKKIDVLQKSTKTNATTSISTSNLINRVVPPEFTSPKHKRPPNNVDLISKVDSTNLDDENDMDGLSNSFQLNFEGISCSKDSVQIKSNLLEVKFNGETYKIKKSPMVEDILMAMRKTIKKNISNEDFEQLKTNYEMVKSPEHDDNRSPRSSETKDMSFNFKMNTNNHNNLSSKNQDTSPIAGAKSHRVMSNQQQPCSSKIALPLIQVITNTKQQTTLSNSSTKINHHIKQNDVKEYHIPNNQQSTTSSKHPMTAVSQTVSVNKQTISNQLHSSSANKQITANLLQSSAIKQQTINNQKQSSPTNKQIIANQSQTSPMNKQMVSNQPQTLPINKVSIGDQHQLTSLNKQTICNQPQASTSKLPAVSVTQLPSGTKQLSTSKPSTVGQSIHDVKKCSKCRAVTEGDDLCTTCRMSSQLKGVTVTRIETPSTISIQPLPEIPLTIDDGVIQLLSSDDEEDMSDHSVVSTLEPVIYKTESQDLIKKHIDKLNSNSKLLEDKLWEKDFSAEDYFKFEQCRSIQIGSFNTTPSSSDGLIICTHGIRMTVKVEGFDPVTIDVHIDNIIKILGCYAVQYTTIFIYTNYLAAAGIQHLLKMKENNKSYYYNPLSKDKNLKKITWILDLSKSEEKKLEKLLLRFKDKYEPLTVTQANTILTKNGETEGKKHASERFKPNDINYEHTVILGDKLDGRTISPVKISDYRMLQIEEFVNDIIIEFYLSWWYMRKLSVEDQNRTYLFSSFFYTQLTKMAHPTSEVKAKSRHNRVKKWTKNVNIFEKDFIFIPINESFHWFMAVICFPYLSGPVHFEDGTPAEILNDKPERPFHTPIESINPLADEANGCTEDPWDFEVPYSQNNKNTGDYETDVENLKKENRPPIKQPCILVFDSLNGGVARARIVATLREWLAEEYKSKHNGAVKDFSPSSMKGTIIKVPQQPNSVDCGLFVCHYFEKFFERPIVDYHCPITHLENWFSPHEVTKNCQKRREVQNTILDMVEEKGGLPPGLVLPTLNFSHSLHSQSQIRGSQSFNQYQQYYNNHHTNDEMEDIDEEEEEEYLEEDENGVFVDGEYHYNEENYADGYPDSDDEVPDRREYYGEMVDNEEEGWQQQINQEARRRSDLHTRNRRIRPNVSNDGSQPYRVNRSHRIRYHDSDDDDDGDPPSIGIDDDDDDEDDDDDDDDDEGEEMES